MITMPSISAHMAIAKELSKLLNINSIDFIKGNLLPDLYYDKTKSHYKTEGKKYLIPNIYDAFSSLDLDDYINVGYLCHLLLDKYYLEEFLDKYNFNVFEEADLYKDYDILNKDIINYYGLDVEYIKSCMKDFPNDIDKDLIDKNLKCLDLIIDLETKIIIKADFLSFLDRMINTIGKELSNLIKIYKLKKIIDNSKYIVALTGAGVSTDSGIKDFRSKDGLSCDTKIPIEILLSRDYFYNNTKEFYDFYRNNFDIRKVKPNIVHYYLKKLEKDGKIKSVVTQNIDGLHSKAGSKIVYELHGTIYKNHCIKCGKEYNYEKVFNSVDVPKCECGGIIKPNVVLYQEQLPTDELNKSINDIMKADMLLVLGTSLLVYPAAGLIDYFRGKYLIIINNSETPYDDLASLVINDNLSAVFSYLK